MLSIEKSIELYKLLANRCAYSGFSNNQAQVYKEMVDFISKCSDIDDSLQKIRNSKYYLAPSVALMKDKLEAWKKAAVDNDMPELADVYEKKINDIEIDEQEIYVTGYEQTAQNIKSDYLNTMQAFGNIFISYISYLCSEDDTHKNDIFKQVENLKKPSNSFNELAKIEKFRELIPLDDHSYNKFVDDVSSILNGDNVENFNTEKDINIDEDFQEISNCKDEIIEAGKSDSWNINYEKVNVVAPDYDAEDDALEYKYIFERQV